MGVYIVAEWNGRLLLIDKHAAHERLPFDQLRAGEREIVSQQLLEPVVLTGPDAALLLEHAALLSRMGIEVEPFGADALAARALPADTDPGEGRALLEECAPLLVRCSCVGAQSATQLMVTVGDNPERLKSEAAFAMLCGVAPVPVSSGMTYRHRLNRGGDRQANSAIHIIAIGRLRTDRRTQDYVAKKLAEGHTKMEALRCLKRYIAREMYYVIKRQYELVNCS